MNVKLEGLRGLPRSAWVLLALTGLMVTADFMVIPYYAVHFTRTLDLSVAFAASAMTAFALVSKGAQFVGGYLIDRFEPEPLITAGFVGMILAFLTLSVARAAAPVMAAMLLLGLGDGCLVIAMRYKLIANSDPGLHPRLFALASICFNIGAVIGPLIGVLLLGLSSRLTFIIVAAVFAVAYLAQRLLTAPSAPPESAPPRIDLRTDLRMLAGHRELLVIVILITGFWVSFSQFQFSVPVVLTALHPGTGREAIGTLFALNGALIVLLSLPVTHALERRSARTVMIGGFVLVQLSYLLLAALQQSRSPLSTTYGVVVVFTMGEILFNTFANTHAAAIAPPGRLATYLGILGLTTGLGTAIGNALSGAVVGPLLTADDPGLVWATFVVVATAFLAVALGVPLRARRPRSAGADVAGVGIAGVTGSDDRAVLRPIAEMRHQATEDEDTWSISGAQRTRSPTRRTDPAGCERPT